MKVKSEKGQIIILLVLGLVGVLAIVALAVDGGQLFAEKRNVQNAADNAAMAGAQAMCREADHDVAAYASALSNGFDNNGTSNTVTVNHPPTAGPNTADNEYVEVMVNSVRQPFFAQLIYRGEFEVTAHAVARCRESYDYAVLALTTRNDIHGLEVTGDGNLIVNGGGIMSDSTHPTGSIQDNGSGSIVAEVIHGSGGVTCDGICSPSPRGGMPMVSDPLAGLAPPSVQPKPTQSTPYASTSCTTVDGRPGLAADFSGNPDPIRLNPGMYCYIKGDAGVDYILNPGIYYIDGQNSGGYGIEVKGNSTISGSGVMIYLSANAGRVYMYGNANVTMEACKSTDASAWCVGSLLPYSGMLFYADRSYTRTVKMIGNAQWDATGTIYAAGSFLDLSGNAAVTNLSSMVVANTITLGGDSNVVVNYDPGLNVTPPPQVSLAE